MNFGKPSLSSEKERERKRKEKRKKEKKGERPVKLKT